jgi:hypothetical protein
MHVYVFIHGTSDLFSLLDTYFVMLILPSFITIYIYMLRSNQYVTIVSDKSNSILLNNNSRTNHSSSTWLYIYLSCGSDQHFLNRGLLPITAQKKFGYLKFLQRRKWDQAHAWNPIHNVISGNRESYFLVSGIVCSDSGVTDNDKKLVLSLFQTYIRR